MTPRKKSRLRPVIWDAFIFDNEFDCLDIRLHELEGAVYRHMLVEADGTFQGNPKPYRFKERRGDYADYPLMSAQVNLTGGYSPWEREAAQRDAIYDAIVSAGGLDSDWVLVSDADEIPSAATLREMASHGEVLPWGQVGFLQRLYFYGVDNLCTSEEWHGTQAMRMGNLKSRSPQVVRDLRNNAPTVEPGGWHFCNLGDAEWLRNKIQSFSHTELNRPDITDIEFLADKIRNREVIDPPAGGMTFELNADGLPDYVTKHRRDLFCGATA